MTTVELVSKYRHTFNTDYTADPNCVAAYLFTEGSGTTVDDASANSNTGNFKGTGEPAWASMAGTNAPSYAPYMADFDGVDDYIVVANHASINIAASNLAVVVWCNRDDTGVTDHIVSKWDNFVVQIANTNDVRWAVLGVTNLETTGDLFPSGSWYHIGTTYNTTSGLREIYVNGVSVASAKAESGQPTSDTGNLYLGMYEGGGANFTLNGKLSETAIFSDTLTSTEINEIMDYGLKPSGTATGYMTCNKFWGA